MDISFLLTPLSMVGLIAWALNWAVRLGQFNYVEGFAYRILFDEDEYHHDGD